MQTSISDLQHVSDSNQEQLMSQARFTQQVIEQKERELQESIYQNYQRIRDVEKELIDLQLQVKLTAEPKKAAMEVLRKKIEVQGNKVAAVRKRHTAAKQAFEELECELNHEEGVKQQLCDELNQLVSTSVSSQLERFEQLKCKLESLQGGGGIGRTQSAPAKAAAAAAVAASGAAAHGQVISSSSELQQQVAVTADNAVPTAADALGQAASQQEREQEAADVAEAAAARSRHVQLPGHSRRQGHQSGRQGSAAGGAADVTATSKQQAGQQQERQGSRQAVQANGRFAGFDA